MIYQSKLTQINNPIHQSSTSFLLIPSTLLTIYLYTAQGYLFSHALFFELFYFSIGFITHLNIRVFIGVYFFAYLITKSPSPLTPSRFLSLSRARSLTIFTFQFHPIFPAFYFCSPTKIFSPNLLKSFISYTLNPKT